MPTARSRKKYGHPPARIDDATLLRQRIEEGQATEADRREYRRLISVFRRKFYAGALSDAGARRLGIE
jgi:hypothetical protein